MDQISALPEAVSAARRSGGNLAYMDDALRANLDVVLDALKDDGMALRFASAQLRGHFGLVMTALIQNPAAEQFAIFPEGGREDWLAQIDVERQYRQAEVSEALLRIKQEGGMCVRLLPEGLRDSKEVMLAAVTDEPLAFRYASARLRSTPDVVRQAVKVNPDALRYAGEDMRDQRDIVTAALSCSGFPDTEAYRFVSARLRFYEDIRALALIQAPKALEFMPSLVCNEKETVLSVVAREGEALRFASERLQADPEVVACATAGRHGLIKYARTTEWSETEWSEYIDRRRRFESLQGPRSLVEVNELEVMHSQEGGLDHLQWRNLLRFINDCVEHDIERTGLENGNSLPPELAEKLFSLAQCCAQLREEVAPSLPDNMPAGMTKR